VGLRAHVEKQWSKALKQRPNYNFIHSLSYKDLTVGEERSLDLNIRLRSRLFATHGYLVPEVSIAMEAHRRAFSRCKGQNSVSFQAMAEHRSDTSCTERPSAKGTRSVRSRPSFLSDFVFHRIIWGFGIYLTKWESLFARRSDDVREVVYRQYILFDQAVMPCVTSRVLILVSATCWLHHSLTVVDLSLKYFKYFQQMHRLSLDMFGEMKLFVSVLIETLKHRNAYFLDVSKHCHTFYSIRTWSRRGQVHNSIVASPKLGWGQNLGGL